MTFIDWSDAEEMVGLLEEYVRDEMSSAMGDRERVDFLRALRTDLQSLTDHPEPSAGQWLTGLSRIANRQPAEFGGDPVMIHIRDCLLELERIVAH